MLITTATSLLASAAFRGISRFCVVATADNKDRVWRKKLIEFLVTFVFHCPNLKKIRVENAAELNSDFYKDFYSNSVIRSRSHLVRFDFVH